MPAVPMEATEQAQALELSKGRTTVWVGPSPGGRHDIQLLLFVVVVDGIPHLAGMETGMMVLLGQVFRETAEAHLSNGHWDSQALSLPLQFIVKNTKCSLNN